VPFDWLFPRVSAVVHHGGTRVTTLGLKHGRPTVICPVIGDQEYWARRLHTLGAAPPPFAPRYRDLTAESLARALRQAVEDPSLRRRAEELGRGVAREDGVTRAVEAIEEVARG
jgi:sterol 3beta-glucosyltransferase